MLLEELRRRVIPEDVPDLYAVIGVKRWAKQPALERGYRRRLAVLQKLGEPTEELETAFAILSDPVTREEYGDLLFAKVTHSGVSIAREHWNDINRWHGWAPRLVALTLGLVIFGMIVGGIIQSVR